MRKRYKKANAAEMKHIEASMRGYDMMCANDPKGERAKRIFNTPAYAEQNAKNRSTETPSRKELIEELVKLKPHIKWNTYNTILSQLRDERYDEAYRGIKRLNKKLEAAKAATN